ncbi:hypothetical protein FBU30_009092 [Linnemannia zychae]|nr:hypothetical protein FBU30_009092 [Linnemannia zychae]
MTTTTTENQTSVNTINVQAPSKKRSQESFRIVPSVPPGTGSPSDGASSLPILFQPLTVKNLTVANRIIVAPMSMYSSKEGFMTDYHLVHLGSYALHGAGLIFAEASAVEPRGRITPGCAGIWSDDHIAGIKRIADFVHSTRGKIGIQLFHAGRKASSPAKFTKDAFSPEDYWNDDVVAPSGGPSFQKDEWRRIPRTLSEEEIQDIVMAFGAAAARADKAGLDTVEIQGAYGYLLHNFLSPITNHRTDNYGGSLENRARLLIEVVKEVRANFNPEKPIFLRLSVTDGVEHLDIPSFDLEQAIKVAQWARDAGVDVLHVASGGNTGLQNIPRFPGHNVQYAARIRKEVPNLTVAVVGIIRTGKLAQEIIESGQADLVAAASTFLKYPSFALEAGRELGVDVTYLPQYSLARYA